MDEYAQFYSREGEKNKMIGRINKQQNKPKVCRLANNDQPPPNLALGDIISLMLDRSRSAILSPNPKVSCCPAWVICANSTNQKNRKKKKTF